MAQELQSRLHRDFNGSTTESLHHNVKGSTISKRFMGESECAFLILSSMEDPLVDDDLLLKLKWLGVDDPDRQLPAVGGMRQADRNAVCGVVTLCSRAEAWR